MFGARICGDSPDVLVHLSGQVIELYAPDIGRRVGVAVEGVPAEMVAITVPLCGSPKV